MFGLELKEKGGDRRSYLAALALLGDEGQALDGDTWHSF